MGSTLTLSALELREDDDRTPSSGRYFTADTDTISVDVIKLKFTRERIRYEGEKAERRKLAENIVRNFGQILAFKLPKKRRNGKTEAIFKFLDQSE